VGGPGRSGRQRGDCVAALSVRGDVRLTFRGRSEQRNYDVGIPVLAVPGKHYLRGVQRHSGVPHGRVLRALRAIRQGRIRATSIASGLGRIIAIGFIFLGLFNNPFLVLIGIFMYFGAQTENAAVQQLELLKNYTVWSAMMTNFLTLSPTGTVKEAADKLLSGSDQDLVVVDNNRATGVMTRFLIIRLVATV
jgi:CBS domain-containing protein